MTVHSLHIFDRKGKTLFTKRYMAAAASADGEQSDENYLSEQRKLIFGMLFSLRETTRCLAPTNNETDSMVHSIATAASTLHTLETASGLRFCLYTTAKDRKQHRTIQVALQHMYQVVWIQCVTRSPVYRPTDPNIAETNFEQQVDEFLKVQPWFS